MNAWSDRSRTNLDTCHFDLQRLFNEVLIHRDCSIICGHRGREEQERLLHMEPPRTQLSYPNSRHSCSPSDAVDVIPYPFNGWNDLHAFYQFGTFVLHLAYRMSIPLDWGGHWAGFRDYPHYELREENEEEDIKQMRNASPARWS